MRLHQPHLIQQKEENPIDLIVNAMMPKVHQYLQWSEKEVS
jgi:hypothetical protein